MVVAQPNDTDAERTTTVTVADQTHTVTQSPRHSLRRELWITGNGTIGRFRPSHVAGDVTTASAEGTYPITFTGGKDNNHTFVPAPDSGQLVVTGFGGAYESLIPLPHRDRSLRFGKITLTVSYQSLAYTGLLSLAGETTPISIRGTLTPDAETGFATGSFLREEVYGGTDDIGLPILLKDYVPPFIDPWLPPSPAQAATKTAPATPAITLAQRLGLAATPLENGAFTLAFGRGDFSTEEKTALLALSPKNTVAPLSARAPENYFDPAKVRITSLKPATGEFVGSFVLNNNHPESPTTTAHTRTVTFQGVFRQPPTSPPSSDIGGGCFLLPGADTHDTVTGEIRLLAPLAE